MQLGWDARYVRWSTRRDESISSDEAVLAAVLEQGKPSVLEAVIAGGADVAALTTAALAAADSYRYDERSHERGERARAIFGSMAEQVAQQFRRKRTGNVESFDFIHTEHVLAALLAHPSGAAYLLVQDHGGQPDHIAEALRMALETYALETDLTWRDRLVGEAWYRAHALRPKAGARVHPWDRYPVAYWDVGALLAELKDAHAYPVLAELYTAIAAEGSMLDRAHPRGERTRQTFPAQDLVMAAHYHRLSGNFAEAAWCARRVIADVVRLVRQIDTIGPVYYEIAYFRELQADAAVCTDRQLAGTLYHEALTLFSRMDGSVEAGEGAEDFGWGGFHGEQAAHFLPGELRNVESSAQTRIGRKLQHWLGIAPLG